MLIKFQPNGTEFAVEYQGDRFVKGDVGVHEVNVVVLDENFDKYNSVGFVQFRRNGETKSSPAIAMSNKTYNIAGATYNGYTFKMNSEWYTAIAGVLRMTVEIKEYSDVDKVKAYGIVEIKVEDSVAEDVPTTITEEQYNGLIEILKSKLDIADEKVYYLKNKTYESYNDFAKDSLYQKTVGGTNIYFGQFRMNVGGGELYNNFEAIGLVNNVSNVLIISGEGKIVASNGIKENEVDISKLVSQNAIIEELNSSKIKVTNELDCSNAVVKVPTPNSSYEATTKDYVDKIKTELQDKIDGIEAAQNLLDIVPNKSELNAYDRTHLQLNDKIKVLQDETRGNAGTYYKWNGTTWEYIGKDGNYYTQAEVDNIKNELLSEIQSLTQLVNTLMVSNVSYKED